MKALDLFCGAGGAGAGLHRAGFTVTGVDHEPQPHYPFAFVRADATAPPLRLEDFDLIWASPPCQAFTALRSLPNHRDDHPNLIPATRALLERSGVPWIIENVPGSPLRHPLTLCGTMFGLGTRDGRGELRRHRWFETSFSPPLTRPCAHRRRSVGVYGHAGGRSSRELAQQFVTAEWREAMGIDWMTGEELAQAIPPAFSEFLALAAIVAMEHVPIAAQGGES